MGANGHGSGGATALSYFVSANFFSRRGLSSRSYLPPPCSRRSRAPSSLICASALVRLFLCQTPQPIATARIKRPTPHIASQGNGLVMRHQLSIGPPVPGSELLF